MPSIFGTVGMGMEWHLSGKTGKGGAMQRWKRGVVLWGMMLMGIGINTAATGNPSGAAGDNGQADRTSTTVVSSLPENLKLILGEGKTTLYIPRVKAIHALGDRLSPAQVRAIYRFLHKKITTQSLPDLEFNALKNELVVVLMKQRNRPTELADHLVAMYKDKSYDLTWRDYCVQFFAKWYDRAPDNAGKKEMIKCLYKAMNERHNRIAGVAGYMLCHLVGRPGFDRNKIADLAYQTMIAPDCVNASKVSLLQVCGELKNDKALPLARRWAVNEKDMLLRVSSIGYLGYLGDSSDLPLLEKYRWSSDIRLQRSAAAAMVKIKKSSSR